MAIFFPNQWQYSFQTNGNILSKPMVIFFRNQWQYSFETNGNILSNNWVRIRIINSYPDPQNCLRLLKEVDAYNCFELIKDEISSVVSEIRLDCRRQKIFKPTQCWGSDLSKFGPRRKKFVELGSGTVLDFSYRIKKLTKEILFNKAVRS